VLANLASNELAMLSVTVGQDVLDEIVAELVTSDFHEISHCSHQKGYVRPTINKRHAWTVKTSLAYTVQIPVQELGATNLQALLDDFGGILVHAILCTEAQDVIDGTATVGGRTMLADMLDTPVTKLAVSDDIDAG
jgi:hypothetical protein